MSIQAPSQLFDNSRREVIAQTPDLKTAVADANPLATPPATPPATSPPSDAPTYDPNSEEWKDFDWENYRKRAAKRLAAFGEIEERYPELRDNLGPQLWMARQLSPPVTRWILSDLPHKSLWEHLEADEMKLLKHEALRGFQQTPGSLRREPVQKRIANWLLKNPDEVHLLLLRWALREPQPPALEAVEAQTDEAAFKGRLPSLLRTFGPNAVGAAVAFGGKPRLFQALTSLVRDDEQLKQILETAPLYGQGDAQDEAPNETPALAPPHADSEAAHYWQQQACELRDSLEKLRVRLEATQDGLMAQANAAAKIKTLEGEIDKAQKRELNKAAQFAKKLEQSERKWAAKYEELNKTEAREGRRVRALQTQIEELEVDNKRHKRQVRQGAQLREEERRKVIALEAKLAELSGAKPAAPKSVNAVSSPPTTQAAPKGVVKVSKPSPLDEIFEWSAHGRRVRMTAREVRRLIDNNDEEHVGTVLLELDALRESNPELRKKFLARLSEAGSHYARVLTHATTRVLVDASNVARFRNNRYGKGQLAHLQLMKQELQRLDCWPIVFIADASLPHNIDQPNELRAMARNGEITITDKGVEADEILAREARATGAYVVTNDAKFFYKVSPDYEPPRISFRVLDGLVVVDEF